MASAQLLSDSYRAQRIRCVIADKSVALSAGLTVLLESGHDIDVVGTATSRADLVALVSKQAIDVVVVGFEPLREALDACREVRTVPALVLTSSKAKSDVIEALRADVPGLLSKETPIDDVAKALSSLAVGGRAYPEGWERAVVEWVDRSRSHGRKGTIGPLTAREQEIVQLVVNGCSNKQLARTLGIAQQTVKNHLHNIMMKVEVESRTELVMWALDGRFVRQSTPKGERC